MDDRGFHPKNAQVAHADLPGYGLEEPGSSISCRISLYF